MKILSLKPRLASIKPSIGSPMAQSMPYKRLVGATLQRRNARILRRDPICKICLAMSPSIVSQSVEVDHVIPLHLGGADTDDNLSGICIPCHKAKTAAEETARAKGMAVMVPHKPREYVIA